MNEKHLSPYENALATLRPESAAMLTESILETLRLEELRHARRKSLGIGLSIGSICGAVVALLLAFALFRPETKPFVENIGTVAVELPNREKDPLLNDLDAMIRNRQRSEIHSETAVPSKRERIIARQLLKELATGRPDDI